MSWPTRDPYVDAGIYDDGIVGAGDPRPRRRLYVASSWRNEHYPAVISLLKTVSSLDVYDFRHPKPGDDGFAWDELAKGEPSQRVASILGWRNGISGEECRRALAHPRAVAGFESDRTHCEGASATLLVLPCGRSAHLELGVAIGRGQKTAIYWPPGILQEPELMWSWIGGLITSESGLLEWARSL